jgi:hypothetical protein
MVLLKGMNLQGAVEQRFDALSSGKGSCNRGAIGDIVDECRPTDRV